MQLLLYLHTQTQPFSKRKTHVCHHPRFCTFWPHATWRPLQRLPEQKQNTIYQTNLPSCKQDFSGMDPDQPNGHVPSTTDGGPLLLLDDILLELNRRFAPFVREDAYVPMGKGDLPLEEKILLATAFFTIVPLRVTVGSAIVILYYLICLLYTALDEGVERRRGGGAYTELMGWRRALLVGGGRFLARLMLFTLGFYWIDETHLDQNECVKQSEEFQRPGVIVSNHVSYLDILYHLSSSFPSFVAARWVADLPLVGLISKFLGCIYIERESKPPHYKGVSGIVTERVLEARENNVATVVLIFPEGTTTNGEFLLPFKTGAFLSKTPVLPVILRYPFRRFGPAWESISGVRHFILLLCQFVNYMEVTYLPVYYPSKREKHDPKLYASNVRKLMAKEGNLKLSDIGLPEKLAYLEILNGLFG